jgi:hypothetical protein
MRDRSARQVCTLVLCSVADVDRAVRAVHTCLKPGGVFLFIEHVASPHKATAWVQHALTPGWRQVGDNCHLNRATEAAVRRLPWASVDTTMLPSRNAVSLLLPIVVGRATKASL